MDDFDFLSTNAAPQQSEATGSEKTAATANIADDASWMMDSVGRMLVEVKMILYVLV